ncbi:MAG: PH domain-containing protein [Atribacterota bacterium]|nr:PH domain-containing protein [Atribacterota bacterium]
MYNSQNLPLSSKKIIKKTINRTIPIIGPLAALLFALFTVMKISALDIMQSYVMETQKAILAWIVFGILFIIAIFVYEYFYYKLYYYDFTDDGAKIKKGVISQATGLVHYARLQNIYVDQDILDRIFGLYDVHYETAGEMSGFYSHVDGLNKENADKLVAFIEGKTKQTDSSLQEGQKTRETTIQPDNITEKNKVEGISVLEYPLSKSVILIKTIGLTIYYSIFFFVLGFMTLLKAKDTGFGLNANGLPWIGFLMILILSWVYSKVWYKNFYFNFDQEKGEIRSKVISSSTSYLYYDRIQNVNLSQSIISRLFGIYKIIIETAGEQAGRKLVIDGLPKESAEKVKDFILTKAKYYRGRL